MTRSSGSTQGGYERVEDRVVYTTNAIEALNRPLRKAVKTTGSFPSEDAARKPIYFAIWIR
jgi:transposase-like protein